MLLNTLLHIYMWLATTRNFCLARSPNTNRIGKGRSSN